MKTDKDMEYTAKYCERKGYEVYDREHVLLYLNEQPAEIEIADPEAESGETVAGWSYTGNMPDGGTMIAASGVTADNCRGKFISGLIGLRYDIDAQVALLANGDDTEQHAAEFAAFSAWRTEAKAAVDRLLARTDVHM